jgi:pimeloyl-[acyl-carrier protein] synthase
VAGLRDRVAQLVEQLLHRVEGSAFDAVADFAAIMPGIVTAAMLGVPEEDHSRLRQWANDFSETFGSFHYDPERTPVIVQSCREMCEYFRDCIRQQRIAPTEGVLNALMTARVQGDKLTDEEVIANCIVIMVGGLETTASLIANGLLILLQLPAQLEILRRDPALLPAAVEELLRYDSPAQHTGRIAPFEVELGGKQIRKGQPVIAVLAAANRDPARFPQPDSFDLSRRDNKHLAFGWASHYCLGAPLARLEAQIAFAALLKLPNLRLNAAQFVWRSHLGLRSVMSLPVRFDRTIA